jgi:hypothetical protein
MKAGDTFLRPAKPTQNEKQHLFIVLTNPNPDNKILIVNITSLKSWQDRTVMLNKGEHPFITETSCVFYREAEIVDNGKLDEAEKNGAIAKRECCSQKLLELVRSGISASPQTKRVIKKFFNDFK